MATPGIHERGAAELARLIRDRRVTPTAVVEATLDRIAARNDRTNAFVTVTEELARAQARKRERALAAGEPLGPLHGVPVAVKDLNDVAGVRTTNGSLLFEESVAEENEVFVDRLLAAGAVVVGKTNTPEFGLGCWTHNRVAGETATPFDPERISGGSSGGAGAALGDRLVPLAQGSDTGGSIRTPAACCGVVGVKPTYGRVAFPRRPDGFEGHTPFSHLGPMARTVEDAALMLDVMAGPHPRDPFSAPADGTDFLGAVGRPVGDLRVAYSPDLGAFPVEDTVRTVVGDAVDALADAGATVEEIDGPLEQSHGELLDAYYTFVRVRWESLFDTLEAEGHDPRGDDRERLAETTVETLLEAEPVSTREYAAANRTRTEVYDAVADTLSACDLLVTPTLGVLPFEHGDLPETVAGRDVDPRRGWLLTQPFNMTGHPVAAVPAGLADGLPVGMQVVGRRFAEDDALAASAALERQRPWRDHYPE